MNHPSSVTRRIAFLTLFSLMHAAALNAEPVSIRIDPVNIRGTVSPHLTGSCIEDVNHEIYGGLYSQMIFGESFQEPPLNPIEGFTAFDGRWSVDGEGVVTGAPSRGGKLVWDAARLVDGGEVSVEIFLPPSDDRASVAGLIVNVSDAANGADRFNGYEVSLSANAKQLRLGRHQQNYTPLREVPCDVAADRWLTLSVRRRGHTLEVFVDGKSLLSYDDPNPLAEGKVGLRTWQRAARFRNMTFSNGADRRTIPFVQDGWNSTSGMWRKFTRGDALGATSIVTAGPFVGAQSQRLSFASGNGEVGIENRGLNRQGLAVVGDRPYVAHVWLRATGKAAGKLALRSADGDREYAASAFSIDKPGWQRVDVTLTPNGNDSDARFEIALVQPGAIDVGYVYLSPGEWGTFEGLPVRRDVAEKLIGQGITAMRYGGSMVNEPTYRWKQMIGERDRRPPYRGHWYTHSTNGWGIIDFLNFAEAAGFLAVPDLSIDESPQDLLDFLEYANGPASTPWGAKRAADGHPQPYALKHIELGNEERVDETYWKKFEAIARALWSKDPTLVLTVGDFSYKEPIVDPFKFSGADSGITTLAAHQKILALAKAFGAEVWFDIHVWTEDPQPIGPRRPWQTFVDAIDTLADGAKHHVVIFELNANSHNQRRAIANAQAILEIERDGRVPFVSSANGLQVDRQNDNGWDQGLLFMNPSQVWLQPPGAVWQMLSQHHQPKRIECTVAGGNQTIDAVATTSDDGKTIVLQAINIGDAPQPIDIQIAGASGLKASGQTLAGDWQAANSADQPTGIVPSRLNVDADGRAVTLPPRSFTIVRWAR